MAKCTYHYCARVFIPGRDVYADGFIEITGKLKSSDYSKVREALIDSIKVDPKPSTDDVVLLSFSKVS